MIHDGRVRVRLIDWPTKQTSGMLLRLRLASLAETLERMDHPRVADVVLALMDRSDDHPLIEETIRDLFADSDDATAALSALFAPADPSTI